MADDIARLSAALAERMRELRTDPTDPRLAPMLAQLQALTRQHIGAATAVPANDGPAVEYAFDLAAELADLLRGYLKVCPVQAFRQAPALAESEAGRQILALAPAERVRMVVAAYHAWSSQRWGGPQ